jgi:FemAB-related protein (PEP-CTERM system-associated)
MSEFEIRPGTAADDEARDALVRAHPEGSFFHLACWERVIRESFGHRPRNLFAWRGDELVGILPMMQCTSLSMSKNLISMPYAVYGGPVGMDAEVDAALVRAAGELGRKLRVGRIELRTRRAPSFDGLPGAPELAEGSLYVTFERELPGEVDGVLAGMPKKARAEARKARKKHELELAHGVWFVDDLYRLFLRNKRQLGSPGMPLGLFHKMVAEFGTDCEVHLVRRGKEALAAVMTFAFGDTLLAYYSGTAEGADRQYSASNFMYMALQEWAVERGFKHFDFGRSRRDSGAMSFKRRQGFEAVDLDYRYLLVRSRELPSFTPSNPKTAILRDTWSKLPPWLVRRLSSSLARFLP